MNTGIAILVGAAMGAIVLAVLWRALLRRGARGAQALRFDGIYKSERNDKYWYYLRFYADGAVLTVSSTGSPSEVIRWFRKEDVTSKGLSHGRYAIRASRVSFPSTSKEGIVDYEGNAEGVLLKLSSYSHVNGHRASRTYSFIQLAET